MNFFVYLCFIIVCFFGANGANGADDKFRTSGGDTGAGGKDVCQEEKNRISEQLKIDCPCKGDNEEATLRGLRQCVQDECEKQCEDHIRDNLSACFDGSSYQASPDSFCRNSCQYPENGKLPVFNSASREIAQAKKKCAQRNWETIQSNLTKQCKRYLTQLSQGRGTLICPGGNAQTPGCKDFCKRAVADIAENSGQRGDCSEDEITKRDGPKDCSQQMNQSIQQALPKDMAKDFAQKGFSFQQCDLGMPCEQDLQQYFQMGLNQCKKLATKAKTCCSDPLKCLPGGTGASQRLFTHAGISAQNSISQNCAQLKNQLKHTGQVSQQMANQCRKSAENCSQSCTQIIVSHIQQPFFNICTFDLNQPESYDPTRHTCAKEMIQQYTTQYQKELVPLLSQCTTEGQKSQNLASTAQELLKSALSAQQCQQSVSAGLATGDTPPNPATLTQKQGGDNPPNPTTLTQKQEGNLHSQLPHLPSMLAPPEGYALPGQKVQQGPTAPRYLKGAGGYPSIGGTGPSPEGGWNKNSPKRGLSAIKGAKHTSITKGLGSGTQQGGSLLPSLKGTGTSPKTHLKGDKNMEKEEHTQPPSTDLDKASPLAVANAKTHQAQGLENNPYLKKPLYNRNSMLDPFGSPHDDIFKRITNRITIMCLKKELDCGP